MIQELKKLNREKNKIFIYPTVILIIFISLLVYKVINIKPDLILAILLLIMVVLPLFMSYFFIRKAEKILVPYILSQCPDWKMIVSVSKNMKFTKKEQWNTELIPPKEIMLSSILPIYIVPIVNVSFFDSLTLSLKNAFSYDNDSLTKAITQIQYISKAERRRGEPLLQFYAGIIAIKNSKNLSSITYFQTNNYPNGTDKNIIKEKSELELPKIELAEAHQHNIDVYSNNKSIAEKLATPELFSIIQNIKQQFNSYYVKAVFYNDYIIFVLRNDRWGFLKYPTFAIKIPLFKNIDYPLLEQAVNNFKTLTDLANQAPEFTKNI